MWSSEAHEGTCKESQVDGPRTSPPSLVSRTIPPERIVDAAFRQLQEGFVNDVQFTPQEVDARGAARAAAVSAEYIMTYLTCASRRTEAYGGPKCSLKPAYF